MFCSVKLRSFTLMNMLSFLFANGIKIVKFQSKTASDLEAQWQKEEEERKRKEEQERKEEEEKKRKAEEEERKIREEEERKVYLNDILYHHRFVLS